jgi:hypothetical protein
MMERYRKQDTLARMKSIKAQQKQLAARKFAIKEEDACIDETNLALQAEFEAIELKDLPPNMASRIIADRIKGKKK